VTAPVRGVCRMCGCSHFDPCPNGCAWADRAQTVCSECAPAAEAETAAVRARGRIRRNPALLGAFHRGFVVGWFAVLRVVGFTRRRLATKVEPEPNPYLAPSFRTLWDEGRARGFAERRAYLARHGEDAIDNEPRPFVYERARRHA